MKNTIIFIILVAFMGLKSYKSNAAVGEIVVVKKVPVGEGDRLWGSNPTYPCPFKLGTDCKVSAKENNICDIEAVGYGYLVTITIDEINCTNLVTSETKQSQVAYSNIYDGEFAVRIVNCSEFPVLNGITVDIPDTIIDEDNNIKVLIPLVNN